MQQGTNRNLGPQAYVGGKAVGSPGVIKALTLAHQKWGKLPWAQLFQPAIAQAEQGFLVSPRLAKLLQIYQDGSLAKFAASKAYFYPNGQPLAAGHLLKNPAYAAVLRKIASEGTAGFYQGDNAEALVQAVNQAAVNPGKLNTSRIWRSIKQCCGSRSACLIASTRCVAWRHQAPAVWRFYRCSASYNILNWRH